jgi:hypothetical protein
MKETIFLTDLEQTQCFNLIQLVKREAVVDACRKDEKIAGQDVNPNPLVWRMICTYTHPSVMAIVSKGDMKPVSRLSFKKNAPRTSKKPEPERT